MRRFILQPSSFIVLALAALVLLFYRQAVFTNLIFARGDTFLYFYPYWDYRNTALLAGHLPLWNPYLFMGVPFLANSQAGVFYPLNWPLIFFSAPVAVKISIIVHVLIAAWGTFALARRAFQLEPLPAFFAAFVFSLGGYLTAQVEHVNQLQGLAWLPLALLSTFQLSRQPSAISTQSSAIQRTPSLIVHCLFFSLFIALQLTAGHTQTTFITLVACCLVALFNLILFHISGYRLRIAHYVARETILGIGAWTFGILLAFALAALQLLPALELSRLSLRGSGLSLNEAVSFSLNPLLLGRALLPNYSRTLFSEFVAYIGVVPLCLSTLALFTHYALRITDGQSRLKQLSNSLRSPLTLPLLLALVGLFFAFGGYNPIYLLLAKYVPGFNFFRVPARWLVLWALGGAILAGHGLQILTNNKQQITNQQLLLLTLPPILLIVFTFISASVTPAGELGPISLPSLLDLGLWLAPILLMFAVLRFANYELRRTPLATFGISCGVRGLCLALGILELCISSLSLPLNHLTSPDTYTSIRPALTQLLAYNQPCLPPSATCHLPADRFLSLSQLEFDPGDLAELHSEWDSQLPPDSVYDAIIATKYQEVLSPNLPLTWHIPSVDGYDGGILPLRAYAEFAQQFGDVPPNTDGRLRQFLKTIPPNWLLNLTNTRWIITDKTGDAWVDNVFYDLGLTATASSPTPITFSRLPNFEATALGLVLDSDSQSGAAQITFTDGETVTVPITYNSTQPALRLRWSQAATVSQVVILTPTTLTLRGASLIDERTDSFHSLALGPYRLAHSGDVKIYENLNVKSRAYLIDDKGESPVDILKYEAEQVVIATSNALPGHLILSDTNYPGWVATIDGQPVDIQPAWNLFRAIPIPAGQHTVEFRFDPLSFKQGALISALAFVVWIALLLYALRSKANVA